MATPLPSPSGAAPHASRLTTLLWGLFCACSWTWCIGMFLPRIMIDRFGWAGFIVFAAPNVIGCAAFGYVVKHRARSEAMVTRHGMAMTAFSIATIAYHMFFAVYLLTELVPMTPDAAWVPPLAAVTLFGLGFVWSFLPDRDWLALAAVVYALSLATFFIVGVEGLRAVPQAGNDPQRELWWLAPTIAFGFLLCPYLDLTFHRTVQRSPSRHAFAVFGAAFAVMLLLTVAIWFPRDRMISAIAMAHILVQSVFTIGAHLREVRQSPAAGGGLTRTLAIASPLLGIGVLYIGRLFSQSSDLGEDLYLRFLVFYGLVFPAYVLILMPMAKGKPVTRRTLMWFGLVVIVCLPMYELGFIQHKSWLLPIALGALLSIAMARLRWIS